MIKNGYELPEPDDGPTTVYVTPAQQLRRLNRIADALWTIGRPLLGSEERISISISPDRESTQIDLHVHGEDRSVAEALVARLGWDPDPFVVRSGIARHYRWHGLLAGYRAYAVFVGVPAANDTQGREPLGAEIGVGNREADAEEARLRRMAAAGARVGGLPVESTGPGQ